MKNISVRDFFWVLAAFLRGKLLQQKAYCPQSTSGNMCLMSGMKGMSIRRMSLLMKWWGLRAMTLKEATALVEKGGSPILPGGDFGNHYDFGQSLEKHKPPVPSNVPYLYWDDERNRWNTRYPSTPWSDDWKHLHRFSPW